MPDYSSSYRAHNTLMGLLSRSVACSCIVDHVVASRGSVNCSGCTAIEYGMGDRPDSHKANRFTQDRRANHVTTTRRATGLIELFFDIPTYGPLHRSP